ncbi:MAG: CheR family methyltransferase [Myxococcota bacterium]
MNARERLERFLEDETGLVMTRGGGRRSIDRVLAQRPTVMGFDSARPYVDALASHRQPEELARLVEAVTVPHSWFHRDADQWRLVDRLLRKARDRAPLSIWVPACATGEDAYTAALVARAAGVAVRVVGTDIHGSALQAARRGHYGAWSLRELPAALASGLGPADEGTREVKPEVRAAVSFAHHNLMAPAPPSPDARGWDLILCRNVLFYFAQPTAAAVVGRLATSLAPEGWLLLGASDMLHAPPAGFRVRRLADRIVVDRATRGATARRTPRIVSTPPPATVAQARRAPVPAPAPPRPEARPSSVAGVPTTAPPPHSPACDDPLDPTVRLRAGVERHVAGDAAGAVTELRAALFLAPTLWPASVYLGLCHERMGRTEDARREFARALRNATEADDFVAALPGDLRGYADELIAIARHRSRRRTA